jgi:hypothetical protein
VRRLRKMRSNQVAVYCVYSSFWETLRRCIEIETRAEQPLNSAFVRLSYYCYYCLGIIMSYWTGWIQGWSGFLSVCSCVTKKVTSIRIVITVNFVHCKTSRRSCLTISDVIQIHVVKVPNKNCWVLIKHNFHDCIYP